MKILMMTNTYAPIVGGLEKSIYVFSEQFRLQGHEVKIVAPEFKKAPLHEKDVIRVPSIEKFVGTDFSVGLPLPEGRSDWAGTKPDNGDEAMAQKIHLYESKLIELTQEIDQSCEDFEKCMIDANQEFEKEFKMSSIKK